LWVGLSVVLALPRDRARGERGKYGSVPAAALDALPATVPYNAGFRCNITISRVYSTDKHVVDTSIQFVGTFSTRQVKEGTCIQFCPLPNPSITFRLNRMMGDRECHGNVKVGKL